MFCHFLFVIFILRRDLYGTVFGNRRFLLFFCCFFALFLHFFCSTWTCFLTLKKVDIFFWFLLIFSHFFLLFLTFFSLFLTFSYFFSPFFYSFFCFFYFFYFFYYFFYYFLLLHMKRFLTFYSTHKLPLNYHFLRMLSFFTDKVLTFLKNSFLSTWNAS